VLKTSEKFSDDDYGIYSKGFAHMAWGSLNMSVEISRAPKHGIKKRWILGATLS